MKPASTALRNRSAILAAASMALLMASCSSTGGVSDSDAPWQDLFNGQDLSGWTQYGGTAEYIIEDGAIVGLTALNTPNSFLATEASYSDFILELEVQVHPEYNSGIQIRSSVNDTGRVFGYQLDLDPTPRAWTGGIYDEGRRGWLYPLTMPGNDEGKKALDLSGWNHIRIEAIGHSIRTWVNGVETADLLDDMTAEGFIALQVHAVGGDPAMENLPIRFRNIRILTEDPQRWARPEMAIPQRNIVPNTLTDREKAAGWKLLWDGETTAGWRGARLDGFPEKGWQARDGVLTVLKSDGGESTNGGDIITVDRFTDFDLQVEFMITDGANSGIKYFVDPDLNQGAGSSIGCEFQILDDKLHPDAKLGVNGNRTLGSLYDLIPAQGKRFSGVGQWNRARVVVQGDHVEHWLNGMKILEYERRNQMWDALVDYSKYVVWPDFGNAASGHILLQDHGDMVHFRSIKIKEL